MKFLKKWVSAARLQQHIIMVSGWGEVLTTLETDQITKTDEFSEKSQTAFDPPFIFGNLYCGFCDKIVTKVRIFIMAGLLCII